MIRNYTHRDVDSFVQVWDYGDGVEVWCASSMKEVVDEIQKNSGETREEIIDNLVFVPRGEWDKGL